jgi:1-deoxy-D-xylulose-5-phosphate reductoisomerase
MKKKIAILGSTGSIGSSTIDIIKKNKNFFTVVLLTANQNYKKLIQQAKSVKAQNVLIKNKTLFHKVKKGLKKTSTKIFIGDIPINKIINKKIDYTIAGIVGIAGLQPTLDAIKFSKVVAIANKESIICGWDIMLNQIKKSKTKLYPLDSEHFSIMELTKNSNNNEIEEIIITASGGPFLNLPFNKLKSIKPKEAVKHPNWRMGKKISVDSANLMNKVFELLEAFKIFNFDKRKYKIIIHPQSYVHSIIRFKNGLIKMILYNADMKIPISNILFGKKQSILSADKFNEKKFNNLTFKRVDKKKFPSINLIKKILKLGPSTPTIINAANEVLVDLFLSKKIAFLDIVKVINKIIKDKEFKKYATSTPKSIKGIKKIDYWARLKTTAICVK